eukprot:CAMPEP_0117693592 /NCGR_PEP_ID=MMETSP0804-20121206/26969_1 /TAXON_ID=1074897 /ORGANISM="Tetraselmis astigmatica, Strain CCMP880" /LENGTH=45 /DNA_ID= /DNA_START= /DNA_END= /DNA_ORIENTATION=
MSQTCKQPRSNWTGLVFVVQHPLSWMHLQTSRSTAASGTKCVLRR